MSIIAELVEKAVIEKAKKFLTDTILVKVFSTSVSLRKHLTEEQIEDIITVIKNIFFMLFDALIDPSKRSTLDSDIKSAVNVVAATMSSSMLNAFKEERDPVVKAVLAFMLASVSGEAEPDF